MLTLEQSFNNVKIICDNALLNKAERVSIDESLNKLIGVLQTHKLTLQKLKEEKEKPQLEDEPNEES